MDELVQFLRDRLTQDEKAAQLATGGPWIAEVSGETGHCVIPADAQSTREYVAKTQLLAAVFDAGHIARHDPARVLRDIEAKRELLRVAERAHDYFETFTSGFASALEGVLRQYASVYADHPDYREEWRP